MTCLTADQYDRWKEWADDLEMSVSEFIQNIVEAGIRVGGGFEINFERDESER